MSLSELLAWTRRVAFVGLAKNTGKTETLTCAVRELHEAGQTVGVTSVGRDGEQRDVIDARIEKPRIELPAWSLVATTESLLKACPQAHERLLRTDMRTSLGRVVVARMLAAGSVEIAGPSAAEDVRAVSDAMLFHGADQVLIDGALDRRMASSPTVSDGLVMSTGAVLDSDAEQVVARTRSAVELVCLPELEDPLIRAIASAQPDSVLVGEDDGSWLSLPARLALSGTSEQIAAVLRSSPSARHLIVRGALCESFLVRLLRAARGRELTVTVADSSKVFLAEHGCGWFARQGIHLRVLAPIHLRALTVNPVAPHSHVFDSKHLRGLLEEAIPRVPILDVRDRELVLV
ncbi:MAG: hypothetical protein H0X28_01525 [Solirubrobacterales bacterium]|nr:hypothetical protein [Solirubrobacterales bacterium]